VLRKPGANPRGLDGEDFLYAPDRPNGPDIGAGSGLIVSREDPGQEHCIAERLLFLLIPKANNRELWDVDARPQQDAQPRHAACGFVAKLRATCMP
jgi:hypothetical protein